MPSPAYTASERGRPEDMQEFHSSVVPMWIFDQVTLEILEVNEAAAEYYGYSRAEFLRMTILDIRPVENIPKLLQSALRSRAFRPNGQVWRHQKKDGTVFPAKIVSWEITFDGHKAELVSAETVQAASTTSSYNLARDLLAQARQQDAIPFDAPKIIKLNHRGSKCAFELSLRITRSRIQPCRNWR